MSKVLIEIDPVEDADTVRTSISIASEQDDPLSEVNYLAVALAQWINLHIEANNFDVIIKDFKNVSRKMH